MARAEEVEQVFDAISYCKVPHFTSSTPTSPLLT